MQRGQVHLFIFVLGLFALAALAWLVAWLTGFPEWAVMTAFVATASFLMALVMCAFSEAIELLTRCVFPSARAVDDRSGRVELRFDKETLDQQERADFDAALKSVVGSSRIHPLSMAYFLPALALFALSVVAISFTPVPYSYALLPVALLAIVAGTRASHRIMLNLEARALPLIGRCGACGYSLRELHLEPDNCRVCPECGAAWKLPHDQPTLSAHGKDQSADCR